MSMATSHTQRGMSLIFALLALVALSLASVALIRSIDTGTLVLGNLGYKQETTALAEQGTQEAIRWLNQQAETNGGVALTGAIEGVGLYAAAVPADADAEAPADLLPLLSASDRAEVSRTSPGAGQCTMDVGADATPTSAACPPGSELFVFRPKSGNEQDDTLLGNVRYTITRLCRNAGAVDGNDCVRPAAQSGGEAQDKSSLDYSRPAPLVGEAEGILYRIVVRAQGTRDTTTYTETIIQR